MNLIAEYKNIDKGFSESFFLQKITNIFYRFRVCFSDRKPEEIEAYVFPDLYNGLVDEMRTSLDKGAFLYTERITVLDASVSGYEQRDGFDYVYATLRTREVRYIINPDTKAYIRGNKSEQFIDNQVVFCRESGLQSEKPQKMSSRNCPYCGAPSDINRIAKCEYCGRILNTDCFDWQIYSASVH